MNESACDLLLLLRINSGSPTQPLLQHFSHLKDPRVKRTQLHPLENILTISICAVICGAENWTETEDFAYAKEAFFSQIIDLSNR
ncbi:transposase family protein [Salmonella enterica]|nr:transposase family protein [Salmonella enterica]